MTTGSREIAWAVPVDNVNKTFTINSLRADLNGYTNATYQIRLSLLNDNGSQAGENVSNFNIVNGIPQVDSAVVGLFKHCSLASTRFPSIGYGSYSLSDLVTIGIPNNDISAVNFNKFIPNKSKVILYDGENFDGTKQEVTTSQTCIFNDRASSLMILPVLNGEIQKVQFYESSDLGGRVIELKVGAYFESDLTSLNFNDVISSVKADPDIQVLLFEDDNFRGNKMIIDGATKNNLAEFSDKVSSILIYKH
ncbi:MAG: peptidase domain protein [Sphingobacterium sp.]|jgi:hypothetical protein|nr:peptidase domain protein [Sphingobacterium sp.]